MLIISENTLNLVAVYLALYHKNGLSDFRHETTSVIILLDIELAFDIQEIYQAGK